MSSLRPQNFKPFFTSYLISKEVFIKSPFVIVDVGARGGFERHWDIFDKQIRLIGFEPDIKEYRRLNRIDKSDIKKYYHFALSNRVGKNKFNIVLDSPQASSFYKFNTKFMSRFYDISKFMRQKTINVATITLDDFIKNEMIKFVDFLKLDVEGCELDVVSGAKNVLASSLLGITLEVQFAQIFNNNASFAKLDQIMGSFNFKLFDIGLLRLPKKTLSALKPKDWGQAIAGHVLYFRDGAEEISRRKVREFWDDLKILKLACLFELYNLPDCSLELVEVAKRHGFLKDWDISYLENLLRKSANRLLQRRFLGLFEKIQYRVSKLL